MATPHSKDARFSFAGSIIRVTAVKFDGDGQFADVTTLNDTYKAKIRGQSDLKLGVEGIYDNTSIGSLITGWADGTAEAWAYYPSGTAVSPYVSGSALVTSYSIPAAMDSAVTFSFDIENTGTPTWGTV